MDHMCVYQGGVFWVQDDNKQMRPVQECLKVEAGQDFETVGVCK